MTSLFTKSKLITLGICLMIILITSALFAYGENKLEDTDLKTSIITFDGFDQIKSEDYYREKFKNYSDALIVLKKDAMINLISPSLEEELNYAEGELLNDNLFQFIHPKDLPFFANNMIDIIHDEKMISAIGPFRIKDPNGQYSMYIADGYPIGIEGEEVSGIVLIVKDISEPVGNK